MEKITLLIQCPDQHGIVSQVTQFIFQQNGNITESNQHSTDLEGGCFYMRLGFIVEEPDRRVLENAFAPLGKSLQAEWRFHFDCDVPRMAIAVSQYDHCLVDLLYRVSCKELRVIIPCVISNHETTRAIVEHHGIPFHHIPVTPETRVESEKTMLDILRAESDFFVMARYMQILSKDFLGQYDRPVINIHHSFLPSFVGANPYKQAYDRGVKIIGATAHYATSDLDEGPIIEQAVARVSHTDTVQTIKRKGRTLEQNALATAIHAHAEHRVIWHENKTIVFD